MFCGVSQARLNKVMDGCRSWCEAAGDGNGTGGGKGDVMRKKMSSDSCHVNLLVKEQDSSFFLLICSKYFEC